MLDGRTEKKLRIPSSNVGWFASARLNIKPILQNMIYNKNIKIKAVFK